MSRFLLKIFIYFIYITLILYLIQITIWGNPILFRIISYNISNAVFSSYYLSKKKSKTKTLILGDSVCRQLYLQGEHGNYYSLASTQAATMVGHYIVMKRFCDYNNDVDTVILVYHPISFQNNLDLKFTYSHFIKPFYLHENRKLISKNAQRLIASIPYTYISQFPYIKMTNWNPHYSYLESLNYHKFFISNISLEYLSYMKEYCKNKHVVFFVIAPPLRKDLYKNIPLSHLNNQVLENDLESVFKYYESSFIFLTKEFFVDEMHYTHKGIQISKRLLINHFVFNEKQY